MRHINHGNPDTDEFVVNPGKPGKLRVGKSESPAKMGALKLREDARLSRFSPAAILWVPGLRIPWIARRFNGCLDSVS
jgi:hypothetical protein